MNNKIEKVKNDIEMVLKNSNAHKNKHIDYILYDPNNNDTYVLASDSNGEAIEFTPFTKGYSGGYHYIQEWEYNLDYYFLDYLEEGKKIGYMTDEIHSYIWNSIDELYPEDIDCFNGVQVYLQYCVDNGITKEYLDEKNDYDTIDIMQHFEGLTINDSMRYKGFFIIAKDIDHNDHQKRVVNIYNDTFGSEKIESVSLKDIGLKRHIKEYIDEHYNDRTAITDEKAYCIFLLSNEFLREIFEMYSDIEDGDDNEVNYNFCKVVVDEFFETECYKNDRKNLDINLQKWIKENYISMESKYLKFTKIKIEKPDEISIIKTNEIHYYRFDWDCPAEDYNTVYLALNGKVSKNPDLCLFATSGCGMEWKKYHNQSFYEISENQFRDNATQKNIVFFYDKDERYNDLLAYPNEFQKEIDEQLLRFGHKLRNKIKLEDRTGDFNHIYGIKKMMKKLRKRITKER